MKKNLTTCLKQYFKDKPEVIAVYIFGSQATDKTGRSGDVDIGILLDTSERVAQIEKRNTSGNLKFCG